MILEVRGGVATQPTEDAPFEHELGLGSPRHGLPQLDRFGGYIVAGLDAPWTNMPNLGVQGPREPRQPELERRGRPELAARQAQLQVRLPDAADLAPADQPVRPDQLQRRSDARSAEHRPPPATRSPRRCWDCRRASKASCPTAGYIDFHTSTLSGYVQDQWSMRPNLTLTYGLRYDYVTRVLGDYGFQSGPDMKTGEWLIGLESTPAVCTGQAPPCLPAPLPSIPFNQYIRATGERDSILKPITDNWGPRVGLAWQLNPRTVLRSGYALMWDSMVSRSQYGQHQYESVGLAAVLGHRHRHDEHRVRADHAASEASTACRSPRRARALEQRRVLQRSRIARTPTRTSGTSRCSARSRATRWSGLAYVGSYNGRMEYAGRPQAPRVAAVDRATDGG